MRRAVLTAVTLAVCLSVPATAAAQTGQSALDTVEVFALDAVVEAGNDVVIASGTEVECTSGCGRMFTTADGGRTWVRAAAAGWSGEPIIVSVADGAVALVADGGVGAIEVSEDLGETFETLAISGRLVGRGGRPDLVVAAGSDDDLWAVDPRTGTETQFPLKLPPGMTVVGTASVPVEPEATMVGGTDADGRATVVRCAGFATCPVVWQGDATFRAVHADDASETVVIVDDTGTIWISVDGGESFQPRSIADLPTDARLTITDVVFAPGAIEVAVVVEGDPDRDSFGDSGVYETVDAGITWQRLGSTPDLDRGAYAIARDTAGFLYAAFHVDGPPSRGVACHGDNGWAAICAGEPFVVGTSTTATTTSTSTTTSSADPASTSATTVVAAPPVTSESGPSGTARQASNVFFAIAAAVVLGSLGRVLYLRSADRRRRRAI